MSAGSNYRLSLFKIKSQAVSHTALTLKHCWHCNTLIYEEGITKGHSIKKANPFYPFRAMKGFRFFHNLSHLLDAEKKAGERVSLQKVIVCVLPINSMATCIKFGPLCNLYQTLGCSMLLCLVLKLRGAVIMIV